MIINDTKIGPGNKTFIIAEIGINHQGDIELAKKLIQSAATCGCDAIKFQKRSLKDVYQKKVIDNPNSESHSFNLYIPILKQCEFSFVQLYELMLYAKSFGLKFIVSPFDNVSLNEVHSICDAIKIGSPDLTNVFLLDAACSVDKPIIISTGMSTMDEIIRSVSFLKERTDNFAVMHCVSTYPVDFKDVNLRFMNKLSIFDVPIGYSGHERGITISVAAVALGASIIERHFTLDRTMRGPDHAASLEPEGMSRMIKHIRAVELALGSGEKVITRGEEMTKEVIGKSITTAVDINQGDVISYDKLTVKSPGRGLSPIYINKVVGKKANKKIQADNYITEGDVE